jgi:hypothetical protein
LNISQNRITSLGLPDIMQLIESMRLHTIDVEGNQDVFNDVVATQHFATTLQQRQPSVQEILGIMPCNFPGDEDRKIAAFTSINNSLTRNRQLNHVDLLLVPITLQHYPQPPRPQPAGTAMTTMWIKTCQKAIAKK